MEFWVFLAIITGAAILCVLWPLARLSGARHTPETGTNCDVEVFKAQLNEIERDLSRGVLKADEAEAMRNEVSRRLLAVHARQPGHPQQMHKTRLWARRLVAVSVLFLLPVSAGSIYSQYGQPFFDEKRQAAQPAMPEEIEAFITQVEERLATHPDDARGWEAIAPVYRRLGRYEDAITAFQNILRLRGKSVERLADLGEAYVLQSSGRVGYKAQKLFEQALALDENAVRPRFFLGLMYSQDDQYHAAIDMWEVLLMQAAPDASWRELVEHNLQIAREKLERDIREKYALRLASLPAEERRAAILGMVEKLAMRLEQEPDDLAGWIRLVESYHILGLREKRNAALGQARDIFIGNPKALKQLNALNKRLL